MSPGHVIAGKYRLEGVVGRGGMGVVWRARHVELGVPLAVKVLAAGAEGDPRAQRRFRQEARAAAALRCPHVVDVRDYGVDEGSPYIVMELLEGESLGARLSRAPGLPLSQLASFLAQASIALDHAHARGFLHRDVKPSNLFLARTGSGTELKVLDFGIVKSVQDARGDSNTMVGSPGYLSPEQALGEALDHKTDLWSLGAVAYLAVTGIEPFAAESLAEVVARVCRLPIPPPSSFRPDLPAALDAFFEQALCRDRAGRFQSGAALAAAFDVIAREAPDYVLPTRVASPGAGAPPRADSTQSWAPLGSQTLANSSVAGARRMRPRRPASPWLGVALLGLLLLGGFTVFARLGRQTPAALSRPEPTLQPVPATPPPRALGSVSDNARLAVDHAAPPAPRASAEPAPLAPPTVASAARHRKPPRVVAPPAPPEPAPAEAKLDPTFGLPVRKSE